MQVYVVAEISWYHEECRGVYSSMELAEQAMQEMGIGDYFVYERTLDAPGARDDCDAYQRVMDTSGRVIS
jgi:hypothetical protein